MIDGFVEISQESPALAEAEAVLAAEALGGGGDTRPPEAPWLVRVRVPAPADWTRLAGRLALARKCLVSVNGGEDPVSASRALGRTGEPASFRRVGSVSGSGSDPTILECGRAYKSSGGSIDLERPVRRYWVVTRPDGRDRLLEQVAAVDRAASGRRRMPLLPFRRPVSLPPKLARAAVNLARVTSGDSVLDPFLGTGALLAEAGLLGARLYGVDRDADMVRGALENLAYFHLEAAELVVGDARSVEFPGQAIPFDTVITDPPYGRSSSTGGIPAGELVASVLRRSWERLAATGRLVAVVPAGVPAVELGTAPRFRIPVRVHRSLTREFCLYEKRPVATRSRP